MVFCKASLQQALCLRRILQIYGTASGQLINLDKSSIIFSKNTPQDLKRSICAALDGVKEQTNAKYLGLPLVIGRSKQDVFNFIIEAVANRTSNWTNQFLSQAGKEVLLKAVISALPVYSMSCLKITGTVCNKIERLASKFWWGANEDQSQKIRWKSWQNLAVRKDHGGMGFRNLQDFHLALLAKQLWRLISQPNLLMSKILRAKYFPQGGLLNAVAHDQASWLWKSWLGAKKIMQLGLRFQVGDGKSIRIWDSPWLHSTPDFKPSTCKPADCHLTWVFELMRAEGKCWNSELIFHTFKRSDAESILQIPLIVAF